ncbi:hypothetical protein [Bifidobacterium dentium]|uniref:hypothetical protein n=1 Tax=Bifidobacterium dentium TaxID=1689 RepID=UPI0018B07718|nr:hypothetical protein [Bifidobacterium dentium]MBF9669210.1 hypothetical protein [Bifidobacterium dentium]MBF9690099.1 hypothetical protein [Bifidobacterium dentium]
MEERIESNLPMPDPDDINDGSSPLGPDLGVARHGDAGSGLDGSESVQSAFRYRRIRKRKGKERKRIQGAIHDHFEEGENHSGKHVRHRKLIDTVYGIGERIQRLK